MACSRWQRRLLGNCAEWLSGGTPSKGNPDYWTGTIPWASAKDMKSFRLLDTEDHVTPEAVEAGTRLVPPNTILLLVRGMTLHDDVPICIAMREMAFNQDVKAVRPAEDVDHQFLAYWLLANKPRLLAAVESAGHGTGRLPTDILKGMEVCLPPLPEQRAIAHVLGTLDDKIELNRRMNQTLEAMAKAIFKSWFVDFDPVRAKAEGRQPPGLDAQTAALFPATFEDSPLGKIPKGWSVRQIREIAKSIQYGLTQSASSEPVGPRFLRITDIQGGRVDWSHVPYCSVSEEEHRRYQIQPGDVLVARTGASTGENIYISECPDAVFASYLVRFQFADPSIARLVGAFMRTAAYFEHVAGAVGGSAQPNASAQVLAGASLVVPDEPTASRFAETLGEFDKAIAANNRQSANLAAIRDSLLPKLLSGDLGVARLSSRTGRHNGESQGQASASHGAAAEGQHH